MVQELQIGGTRPLPERYFYGNLMSLFNSFIVNLFPGRRGGCDTAVVVPMASAVRNVRRRTPRARMSHHERVRVLRPAGRAELRFGEQIVRIERRRHLREPLGAGGGALAAAFVER